MNALFCVNCCLLAVNESSWFSERTATRIGIASFPMGCLSTSSKSLSVIVVTKMSVFNDKSEHENDQ